MYQGWILLPKPYSLEHTLLSGQVFRWLGPDLRGWFEGVAGGVFWSLRQEGGRLHWRCSGGRIQGQRCGEWLRDHLRLDDDMSSWVKEFGSKPIILKALSSLEGMRLIRQEPFECAVSYLYAQGLSVKAIQSAIAKLCVRYGQPIPGLPADAPMPLRHAFPSSRTLAGLKPTALRPFANNNMPRARHIVHLAREVEGGKIDWGRLKGLSCDEARTELKEREGIGPKIADCILLFSLDHLSAFPLDRWVYRAMRDHYGFKSGGAVREAPTPSQYPEMTAFARQEFGSRCGVASEYLFLYLRSGLEA